MNTYGIDESRDLKIWTKVGSVTLTGNEIVYPVLFDQKRMFFKTVRQ